MAASEQDLRILTTADDSPTLFSSRFQSSYHSLHGALQESRHVFIRNGLHFRSQMAAPEPLKVLEYGFGTGLNALLTALESNIPVDYTGLDLHPLPESILEELCFPLEDPNDLFPLLHALPWDGKRHSVSPAFTLRKFQVDFVEFQGAPEMFDLIYFDAFSPSSQPELWSLDIARQCFRQLAGDGALVTYSSQGQFRRNLVEAGFRVEKLQGPPGKREMVRAVKPRSA